MRINSDFRDYYDPFADRDGPVLDRVSTGGPGRREQHDTLERAGFTVPPRGQVGDVLGDWWEAEKTRVKCVVAYEDEAAHRGEGKRVFSEGCLKSNSHPGMPGGDRHWRERLLYCTAFVGCYPQTSTRGAVSWRRLQVGEHVFWLEYRSAASWQSNVGDGGCSVIGVEWDAGYHPAVRLPLWAADFVLGREMYAVDFNTAPGIRGSGVERLLPGPDACRVLGRAVEELAVGRATP